MGSSLLSVGDLHRRLKDFNAILSRKEQRPRLYFAKVDVKSAFDTIPQHSILRFMGDVPPKGQKRYTVAKHVQIKAGEAAARGAVGHEVGQAAQRWHTVAIASHEAAPLPDMIREDLGPRQKNTIFVDTGVYQTHATAALLTLMAEHVATNLVKIGKKFYRQKSGIPQGSILSSMLCNYFYANLEATQLDFIRKDDDGCVLMRLIDDFLLITTDRAKAAKFVTIMHKGIPRYGVTVNATKSLVNFDLELSGQTVARASDAAGFPYCGTLIDTRTLDISRDRGRQSNGPIANSLTIDFGRLPGQNFQRKVLSACVQPSPSSPIFHG